MRIAAWLRDGTDLLEVLRLLADDDYCQHHYSATFPCIARTLPPSAAFAADLTLPLKDHNVAFGRALRKLRLSFGKSQEALAYEAGLDRTYISLLELGRRSPTLDTIMLLCDATDQDLEGIASLIQSELNAEFPDPDN